tara:strand:- start:1291 stop:1899 length:609 start_codon:yes stop_codon:yes gene_type:complete
MDFSSLIKGLRRQEFSVEVAVDAQFLSFEGLPVPPASLLHYFACDCAERMLLREHSLGREFDSVYADWLTIKRSWLAQKTSEEELVQVIAEAKHTLVAFEQSMLLQQEPHDSRTFPVLSVMNLALQRDPFRACTGTARGVLTLLEHDTKWKATERTWQRYRLIWLLSLVQFAGERWLTLVPGGETPQVCPPEAALEECLMGN